MEFHRGTFVGRAVQDRARSILSPDLYRQFIEFEGGGRQSFPVWFILSRSAGGAR
jgi:hypothetical protein